VLLKLDSNTRLLGTIEAVKVPFIYMLCALKLDIWLHSLV